jgi:protein MpaA
VVTRQVRLRPVPLLLGVLVAVSAACTAGTGDDAGSTTAPTAPPAASATPVSTDATAASPTATVPASTSTTTATTTVPGATTTAAAATTTTTDEPGTTTTTTTPVTTAIPVDGTTVELGRSIEGRPILVHRRGTPGGVAVLVVGVIHGDEDAGAAIVDRLLRDPVPDGVDLWVVPSMNPDGQAAQRRHNAAGVDLNRNFPERWGPIAAPGDWQYAGPAPASEPETRAMLGLTALVAPDLVLWYHQDLFRISPATGLDGEVRARYGELTGLPLLEVSGGTYTGTASIWSRSITAPDGVGFTVELGPDLSDEDASRHAAAVFAVAAEFFGR